MLQMKWGLSLSFFFPCKKKNTKYNFRILIIQKQICKMEKKTGEKGGMAGREVKAEKITFLICFAPKNVTSNMFF